MKFSEAIKEIEDGKMVEWKAKDGSNWFPLCGHLVIENFLGSDFRLAETAAEKPEPKAKAKLDLSRIDFGKCGLPELWGCRADVRGGSGVVTIWTDARACAYRRAAIGDRWLVCHGVGVRTFEELDELRAICDKVDAFVATETARLKLEAEYPMSADDAREFLRTHPGEHLLEWQRVTNSEAGRVNDGKHWHRWNDSRGVVEAQIGTWVFDSSFDYHRYRLLDSRNVPQEPEDEYPMSADEAREFLRTHPGEHLLEQSNGNKYWHRAAADGYPESLVSTWGRRLLGPCRYRLLDSRNVPQEPDWVPVPWWEVEELQNKGVEVRYESRATGRFEKRSFPSHLASKVDNYVVDRHTLPAGYVPSFERWETKTADELLRMMMVEPGKRVSVKDKTAAIYEFWYEQERGICPGASGHGIALFNNGPYKVKVA